MPSRFYLLLYVPLDYSAFFRDSKYVYYLNRSALVIDFTPAPPCLGMKRSPLSHPSLAPRLLSYSSSVNYEQECISTRLIL